MQIVDSYPVVITPDLHECRDFYVMWLDFEVVFEASWFVLLNSGAISIAFMHPEHPSSPPDPGAYRGDGAFLTLQVEDAGAEYESLMGRGLQCALPLTDEPWGQRRFGLVDPAGMWVDVVEQTQPEEGWWDPYLA
jgi:catechol 2,3-dioxygenase-like lactoylglutathione lyase family enzyme